MAVAEDSLHKIVLVMRLILWESPTVPIAAVRALATGRFRSTLFTHSLAHCFGASVMVTSYRRSVAISSPWAIVSDSPI
jgi:hypothetical protein